MNRAPNPDKLERAPSPSGRYVDQVRLEAARRLLEDTADSIEAIARSCGYGNPETMRRAFLRAFLAPPAEYRPRFRSSLGPQPEQQTR